jgi:outer membrane lipoprotein-sorting protein
MLIKNFTINIFIIFIFFYTNCVSASNLDPKEILDSVDDLYRSNASHGILILSVTTVNWQRTLTLEQWSKGQDKSLIKILKPKKEKGLTTLRVDKNVWNYMPKVKRVVKIPSSMMSSSWMGSHFTNDDLVKQSRMADNYTFSVTFEGKRDEKEIIEITCIPNKVAAVVWGKVEVVVYADDYIPLQMTYYDEDLLLSRTLEFTNVEEMDGKMIPTLMSMIPTDEPGESTTVKWEEIQFNVTINDEFFSLRKLQQ